MLCVVLLAAFTAAVDHQLPYLPDVFTNNSSFANSTAALNRFYSSMGGSDSLEKHREILRSIMAAQGVVQARIPAQRQKVIDQMAARMRETVIDRPSIADINKPIAEYLFGGDIMLSTEDLSRMGASKGQFPNTIRTKRGAPVVTSTRWPKTQPIGFIFASDIDEATQRSIRTASQKIGDNTCLSFKENSGIGTQLQFHRGGGCWSYLGRQIGSIQKISIDIGCELVGIVGHEISHALGIDHTQNRKDRDSSISVNIAAVPPNNRHNFVKLSDSDNNNFGVAYDYGSDLHYGAFDFSSNGQAVLVASQADYINTMGQRKYLTFSDYKMINALYNCSENCPKQIKCQNGGYPSPKDCNKCICTEFHTGTTCQTLKTTISITSTSPGRTAYHQEYNPTLYTSGNNYNWDMFGRDVVKIIRAPEGRKIRVTINQINAAFGQLPCYQGCPFVGLEFVDSASGDLTTMGKIFCCTKDEKYSFVSQSNFIGYKAYASPGMPFDGKVTYTVV